MPKKKKKKQWTKENTVHISLKLNKRTDADILEEIFISHVLFPWETFAAQAEREQRERKNGGARWTESFRKEVRENILRYANTTFFPEEKCGKHAGIMNKATRNSSLNEVYRLVPYHFRDELFAGVSFPLWENR